MPDDVPVAGGPPMFPIGGSGGGGGGAVGHVGVGSTAIASPPSARHAFAGYIGRHGTPLRPEKAALASVLALKVLEVAAGGRADLSLVLRAQLPGAVRLLRRRRHREQAELPDLHARIDRDGQVGNVGQLE